MTQRQEMMATFEAVLFVSPEPVSRNRLLELFGEAEQEEAKKALGELLERYRLAPDQEADGHGVRIEEVAGGLRLTTRPHLNEALRRFFEASRAKKLSMGALETLAIIAYRQPVTSPEIQELRGVSPSGVLKTLLERRMVRIAGRKEVVGKPFLYATTQDFLIHFGLRSLKDLPPLEEFEEALAGDGLGELLAGPDHEEQVLQEAASLEESADDDDEDEEIPAEGSPWDPPGERAEEAGSHPVDDRVEDSPASRATGRSPDAEEGEESHG